MPAGKTYEPIKNPVVVSGSSTTSVTFSSISSAYTDLIITVVGTASADTNIVGVINGSVSTTDGSDTYFFAQTAQSTPTTGRNANGPFYLGNMATTMSNNQFHFMNYANTTTIKNVLSRSTTGGTTEPFYTVHWICNWQNTAAINSIQLKLHTVGATFNAGTVFSIYGIAAA